ncbi:HU family DNA-binding protein [Thermosulfurimonas marina]|uniref:HU family DNA-binding protein n=1 Tax=Thermosulfurimonas marina TaxID=2047767 RepID=A0A6H1WU15_9BACT|nr:HU family DNA-binding protein [Thermosulfurimonas marina]QJA06692.1 HU family DNA-binding protein [Thermosulfurimonas marina]
MRFQELEARLYRRLKAARVIKSRAEVRTLLATFLEILSEGLLQKKKVLLTGFGRFEVTQAGPRRAYDFRTGRPLEVPARARIVFRASPRLKKALSGK